MNSRTTHALLTIIAVLLSLHLVHALNRLPLSSAHAQSPVEEVPPNRGTEECAAPRVDITGVSRPAST